MASPTQPCPAPSDPSWGHARADGAGGVKLHYVRRGQGPAVVLLHGWPGFWFDWRRVLPLLEGFDVIAPDFRGFGESDKPPLPPAEGYGPDALASDIVALLDALGLREVVLAGHDVGATVAQVVARSAPERVRALVLFNPSYPGIGQRRFEPAVQPEFWYQHFHNQPWCERLVARDRESVRIYLAHCYDHWLGRKEALVPAEFEAIVDAYARPGAFAASIAYYRARAGARIREATPDPARLRISTPTVVRWGELDPVMRVEWSDRLPVFFSNLRFKRLPRVGHYVPFEAPEEAAAAIREAAAS